MSFHLSGNVDEIAWAVGLNPKSESQSPGQRRIVRNTTEHLELQRREEYGGRAIINAI